MPPAGTGRASTRITTGEARTEADSSGAPAGVGLDALLGQLGVLSMGLSASHANSGNGRRTLLGFDRSSPFFSFAIRSTWASRQYREIGDEGPKVRRSSTGSPRCPWPMARSRWRGPASRITTPHPSTSTAQPTRCRSPARSTRASRSIVRSRWGRTRRARSRSSRSRWASARPRRPPSRPTASTAHQDTRAEASVQRGLPLGEGIGYYLRGNSEGKSPAASPTPVPTAAMARRCTRTMRRPPCAAT